MLPSCVPAVDFERSGAVLTIEHLRPFLFHPRVLGLAEVMNYPAVRNAEKTMIDKLLETAHAGKKIDGHAAGLNPQGLNIFMAAGIRTDHEAVTMDEAKARLQKGMYVMIREGTVAKDLKNLIGIVNERNARRCLFEESSSVDWLSFLVIQPLSNVVFPNVQNPFFYEIGCVVLLLICLMIVDRNVGNWLSHPVHSRHISHP